MCLIVLVPSVYFLYTWVTLFFDSLVIFSLLIKKKSSSTFFFFLKSALMFDGSLVLKLGMVDLLTWVGYG